MDPDPNLKRCKYNVLGESETGEKTYEPLLFFLSADDPVTYASYAKGNGLSHIDGWARYKNHAQRNKHDLSCIASPKEEMKSTFSWTSLSKIPTSSTLCFGEPTLEKLNQIKLLYSPTSSTSCNHTLAKPNQETEFVSPCTFLLVNLWFILELPSLCQDLLVKQTEFPTDTPS